MASAAVERGRQVADHLLGSSSRVFEADRMLAYTVPPPPAASPPALWLDTGWSNLERLEERGPDGRSLRWRWMGERARLGAIAAEPVRVRLTFVAQAFGRVRRLQLVANGSSIVTIPIGPDRAAYQTPAFLLTPDVRFVELRSLDGADTPGVGRAAAEYRFLPARAGRGIAGERRPTDRPSPPPEERRRGALITRRRRRSRESARAGTSGDTRPEICPTGSRARE